MESANYYQAFANETAIELTVFFNALLYLQ